MMYKKTKKRKSLYDICLWIMTIWAFIWPLLSSTKLSSMGIGRALVAFLFILSMFTITLNKGKIRIEYFRVWAPFLIVMGFRLRGSSTLSFIMDMAVLVSCIIICSSVISRKVDADSLIKFVFYIGLIVAIFVILDAATRVLTNGLSNIYLESAQRYRNRVFQSRGLFIYTGITGGFLVSGIGAYLFIDKATKRTKAMNVFVILMYTIALLYIEKRGFIVDLILIAFAFIAILIAVRYKKNNLKIPIKTIYVLIGAVILFAASYVAIPIFRESVNDLVQRFTVEDSTFNGRTILYGYAIKLFKQSPLLGIGWGNYKKMTSGLLHTTLTYETHNVYLQLLCETGILGCLSFIFATYSILFKTIRKYYRCIFNGQRKASRVYGFSLFQQLFFLTYALTGNPLYDYNFLVMYFLGIAFLGIGVMEELLSEEKL